MKKGLNEDDRKGQNTTLFGNPHERPRHENPVK
ncbi:hypothetical protein J2S09_005111 [Bacillus fengqiuensis]|nr:hypothetical protein [Bacillus fengqiuensis]